MAEQEQTKTTEQEEQAKKEKEKKEKEQHEKECRFNRRVNYFIMRYMWQVVCGRNPDDTIYMAFNMSRERYTRIINTGVVRYAKGELDSLSQITGIRKEIFSGEKRFQCLHKVNTPQKEKTEAILNNKEVKDTKKIDITGEEWDALFTWRKNRKKEEGEDTPQEKIYKLLKRVNRSDVENWDFYRLCYFLKERRPAPLKVTAEQIRDIEKAIRGLTFSMMDRCDIGQLLRLKKLIKEKEQLITGIIVYKNAKKEESN